MCSAKMNQFVVLLQVLVTNVQCKDEPISTCTKGVLIEYKGHIVHVHRKEGDKIHEVYIYINYYYYRVGCVGSLVGLLSTPEDKGDVFHHCVGKLVPNYMASHLT
jgi:hypothetical protein